MPLVRSALLAAAASLIATAALAQTVDPNASVPPTPPDNMQAAPAPDTAANAASNTSATVTGGVQMVASQPIPDTPANRAQFGQPLSRAGKLTQPAGN